MLHCTQSTTKHLVPVSHRSPSAVQAGGLAARVAARPARAGGAAAASRAPPLEPRGRGGRGQVRGSGTLYSSLRSLLSRVAWSLVNSLVFPPLTCTASTAWWWRVGATGGPTPSRCTTSMSSAGAAAAG